MSEAAQTPILDLLRNVPRDARLIYEHPYLHSQSIPVGSLALRAADRIAELEKALLDARNYVDATVLNAGSPKTRQNYQGCLNRIDAAIAGRAEACDSGVPSVGLSRAEIAAMDDRTEGRGALPSGAQP